MGTMESTMTQSKEPRTKLHCYVDETGQDTAGKLFIVVVIVLDFDPTGIQALCEQLEKSSGKGKFKWGKAKHELRLRFLRQVFADSRIKGCLRYSVFRDIEDRNFDEATVKAIADA
jgi:hypothetical protein